MTEILWIKWIRCERLAFALSFCVCYCFNVLMTTIILSEIHCLLFYKNMSLRKNHRIVQLQTWRGEAEGTSICMWQWARTKCAEMKPDIFIWLYLNYMPRRQTAFGSNLDRNKLSQDTIGRGCDRGGLAAARGSFGPSFCEMMVLEVIQAHQQERSTWSNVANGLDEHFCAYGLQQIAQRL